MKPTDPYTTVRDELTLSWFVEGPLTDNGCNDTLRIGPFASQGEAEEAGRFMYS